MSELHATIGLEIHVQLKTKSKMFCRCDNDAENKAPNTTVCPICLGMPGSLPVTNKQAVLWTIKTGLAVNCTIPKIAKFDRKHYFYPDLPKGYQISQYDEPFCVGGYLEVGGAKVRFNRIHLEEDAGKLIHSDGKSLADLNRAGTPLMEMVTEPDITSPKQAGDFLRELQKIVRDVVQVSDANMEKGHLRCDANISVSDDDGHMSQIVEIKNLNSFRFVEKALAIEDEKLKGQYPDWPEKLTKATHGYDSKKNETYVQRVKEEAADYRYFPEPDLPPVDTTEFDLEELSSGIGMSEEEAIDKLIADEILPEYARILARNKAKLEMYNAFAGQTAERHGLFARLVVNNNFGFAFSKEDYDKISDYTQAVLEIPKGLTRQSFEELVALIHEGKSFEESFSKFSGENDNIDLDSIISKIITNNSKEVEAYRLGKKQLFGFFMGQVMKETGGKADPTLTNKTLREMLEK